MAIDTIEELLSKAELALRAGDPRSAGILIDRVLQRDFTNSKAWHLLYQIIGDNQDYDAFRASFVERYFPDKVHLLEKRDDAIAAPIPTSVRETNPLKLATPTPTARNAKPNKRFDKRQIVIASVIGLLACVFLAGGSSYLVIKYLPLNIASLPKPTEANAQLNGTQIPTAANFVGEWKASDGARFAFFADATVIVVARDGTITSGTYQVLSTDELQITSNSQTKTMAYRFNGSDILSIDQTTFLRVVKTTSATPTSLITVATAEPTNPNLPIGLSPGLWVDKTSPGVVAFTRDGYMAINFLIMGQYKKTSDSSIEVDTKAGAELFTAQTKISGTDIAMSFYDPGTSQTSDLLLHKVLSDSSSGNLKSDILGTWVNYIDAITHDPSGRTLLTFGSQSFFSTQGNQNLGATPYAITLQELTYSDTTGPHSHTLHSLGGVMFSSTDLFVLVRQDSLPILIQALATPTPQPTAVVLPTPTPAPTTVPDPTLFTPFDPNHRPALDFVVTSIQVDAAKDGWTTGAIHVDLVNLGPHSIPPQQISLLSSYVETEQGIPYDNGICYDIVQENVSIGAACQDTITQVAPSGIVISIDPLNGQPLPQWLPLYGMDLELRFAEATTPTVVILKTSAGDLDLDLRKIQFGLLPSSYFAIQHSSPLGVESLNLTVTGTSKVQVTLDVSCPGVTEYQTRETLGFPVTVVNTNQFGDETATISISSPPISYVGRLWSYFAHHDTSPHPIDVKVGPGQTIVPKYDSGFVSPAVPLFRNGGPNPIYLVIPRPNGDYDLKYFACRPPS